MKHIKLIFTILIVLIAATNTITAQQKMTLSQDQKEMMKEQSKKNKERLALSEEQEVAYKEINKKYAEKLKTLKTSEENKRGKLKALKNLQDNKNAELKSILSASQYKTHLEIQAERKAQIKERKQQQTETDHIE